MNSTTGKGFQPVLPSKSEIVCVRKRFKSIIRTWRTKKIKTVFGYLNALVYRACKVTGILKQVRRAVGERKGFHRIVGDIQAIALKGIDAFNITIEGIADQLFNFWNIKISETSLRLYRYELRDVFGLFWFESQPVSQNKNNPNARRPPALVDFDLVLACILLEALEDVLLKELHCALDEFPGNAAMNRFIYDALFRGITSYRRKEAIEDAAVISKGKQHIRVSEIDWNDSFLTQEGAIRWYGSTTINYIPNENGLFPIPL
jgi:hypothetical protein